MLSDLFDDSALQSACRDWSNANISSELARDGLLERIRQLLVLMKSFPRLVSHVDLICLIRQWQLRNMAAGANYWLRVPRSDGWPSASAWREAGFDVAEFNDGFDARARPIRIPWLGIQENIFDDVFAEIFSRTSLEVPADPCLRRLLGNDTCLSEGQREALRAVIHLPADVTLIANLPTGSGKSSLCHLPPLFYGEGHLTLTIVPTVALAIDQARRMKKLLLQQSPSWEATPLAYHGGLTPKERDDVRRAIQNGTQRMIFASPESATGSLRNALEHAAAVGRLTHIVVDEAHLVATWGSGFRPEFQLLPALVRHLRKISHEGAKRSVRLILASATLTKGTIDVLQKHFGPAAQTELISGVHLRSEPRYTFKRCRSKVEQRERVLEVLKLAPRPFILYVTKPEEAVEFRALLRDQGFGRIEQFTGLTGASERDHLLSAWNLGTLDGMVATSAFGLGVDKADVRTIVHATLPESLDRFYQEVGRSGRDGKASASLLLYTEEDIHQARGISLQRLIGNDLGYKRWGAMIGTTVWQQPNSDLVWVDLDALRSDLYQHSAANRGWNFRTLNLMALAGMLEICALRSYLPEFRQREDEVVREADAFYAAVRILETGHLNEAFFNARMNTIRSVINESSDESVESVLDVASGKVEISLALTSTYELARDNAYVPVTRCCGGCPQHWTDEQESSKYDKPFVSRISRFATRMAWRKATATLPLFSPNLLIVTCPEAASGAVVRRSLIEALLSKTQPHTVLLDVPAGSQEWTDVWDAVSRAGSDAFIDTFDSGKAASLDGGDAEVRIVLWSATSISQDVRGALLSSPCALTVLVIPTDIKDPDRPDRRWTDVIDHLSSDTLLKELSA